MLVASVRASRVTAAAVSATAEPNRSIMVGAGAARSSDSIVSVESHDSLTLTSTTRNVYYYCTVRVYNPRRDTSIPPDLIGREQNEERE